VKTKLDTRPATNCLQNIQVNHAGQSRNSMLDWAGDEGSGGRIDRFFSAFNTHFSNQLTLTVPRKYISQTGADSVTPSKNNME